MNDSPKPVYRRASWPAYPARWLAAGVLCALLTTPVWASGLYRYENDDGVLVISHSIPPDMVHKGYQVLDDKGRVVRVVERQLTPDEIAAREAIKAAEERAAQERADRQRRDRELMMLYASPDDVVLARDRRLASIQNAIRATHANIERLKNHKRQLEAQAADRERAGQAPSQELLDNMQILDIQIRESEREISARWAEVEATRAQFDAEHARVKELYEGLAHSR